MGYLEESLSTGEVLERKFEPHWLARMVIAGHFLLCIPSFGLWLPVALHAWLVLRCTEQGVTNKRIVKKTGIVARTTDEMRLGSIEAIHIEQTFLGRVFGYGVIVITGRGVGDVRLTWVADPVEAKRVIESAEHALGEGRRAGAEKE